MAEPADLLEVELWTDGSCYPNPGPGGWAFVLTHDALATGEMHRHEGTGYADEPTTNNRMEMQAVIQGFKKLKRPCFVRVFCDSAYVVNQMMGSFPEKWARAGWKNSQKKPVKNRDLWEILWAEAQRHRVQWNHIRGHQGIEENERCDVLAGEARLVSMAVLQKANTAILGAT